VATSLVASIKDHYEIEPVLVIGHDGIFEVLINGDKVYTNNSECSVLPKPIEILEKINERGGSPIKPLSAITAQALSLDGAACPLPGALPDKKKQVPLQQSIAGLNDDCTAESSDDKCGCSCDSC
jgi:hypothetical protein